MPDTTKPASDDKRQPDPSPDKSGELSESQLDEVSGGEADPCAGGKIQ
jgi:hypothetical protein